MTELSGNQDRDRMLRARHAEAQRRRAEEVLSDDRVREIARATVEEIADQFAVGRLTLASLRRQRFVIACDVLEKLRDAERLVAEGDS